MNSSSVSLRGFCVLAFAGLLISPAASAQLSKLDDASGRLAKEFQPLKPHLVAVVDFHSPEGNAAPLGHFFASLVSDFLKKREKQLNIAEHSAFDADIVHLGISSAGLVPGASLQAAAPHLGTDFLVIGTVEKQNSSYVLQLTPVRVADGSTFKSTTIELEASEFLDSFASPFPAGILKFSDIFKSAEIIAPSCRYCPDPLYTQPARRNQVQGTAGFDILISKDGDAQQIRPVRLLGYGLDEQAFNTIKKWKFKPATMKKDGAPVAVITPVDVTFRLF
jgi:TonB family protein